MTLHRPDISALVGSRICHDLISPLGAIGNGLELLSLTGASPADGPEMALITESVESANARIKFFRIAFGAAHDGQNVPRAELEAIMRDSFRAGRIEMRATLPAAITRAEAKLALLVILCLETTLPRGGVLTVGADDTRWRMTAQGDRINAEARLWQGLTTPNSGTDGIAASEVQFALLPEAARQAGRALAVNLKSDGVEVRF